MKIPANIKKPLQVGSKGKLVRILENKLKDRGLLKGPVDGFFDARTKAAVKKLEAQTNRKQDGVVGNPLWDIVRGAKKPAPPPSTPGAPKGEAKFKSASINVKSNPVMPQSKVLHDVKQASKQADLIGWQEIGPSRYFDAIKGLGKDWGHYMPKDGKLRIPIPISWKKSEFELKDSGFIRTHKGEAKITPNRYITWVKLRNKETGQDVIRINTHFISGAWSKPKPTTAWRREMWNIHQAQLEKLVAKFKKQGLNVIVGGDFNRDSYKVLGNQVKYDNKLNVGTHGGPKSSTLDYMMHWTKTDDLEKEAVKIDRNYASDHDAVVVTYSLDKK